jgi:hypothetical protein
LNTANDIIGGLTTLFGGSNSGGSNEYITAPGVEPLSQSLKQDVKLSLQKWAPNTKVDDIYAAYSDLAVRSAKALCQVKARHAPTVWFDDKLTVIRRAMGEWRILSGEGGTKTALCLNPEDCVSKRRRTIQDLITKEDQALIDAADVKAKWTSLSVDNVTPTPDSYWQTMLKYLGITGAQPTDESYISQREAILFGLRDIELRVAALKSNWQWRATQEWAAATTAMDTLRKSLNAADYHIKQLDRQVWETRGRQHARRET